nr:DNA helicase [Tanacetum cinerariifolium]
MTGIDYTSPSGDELCGGHRFDVMPLGDSNVPDGRAPLSIGTHEMMHTTNVPVSMVFDRFRNMRLNRFGSDYVSQSDLVLDPSSQLILAVHLEEEMQIGCHLALLRPIAMTMAYTKTNIHTRISLDLNNEGEDNEFTYEKGKHHKPTCLPSYSHSLKPLSRWIQRILKPTLPWPLCIYLHRGREEETLNPKIVKGLIHVLDEHNGLVMLFRIAHDKCNAEPGFYPELLLNPKNSRDRGQKVTMNACYKYQLHLRVKGFGLIFRYGRLFQQYVVAAFCAIEQSCLDFIRKHQCELRFDYLLAYARAILESSKRLLSVAVMEANVMEIPATHNNCLDFLKLN